MPRRSSSGGLPLEEEDIGGLIELNRDAWYAAQRGLGCACTSSSSPKREEILADPLAGFRAAMDAAPDERQGRDGGSALAARVRRRHHRGIPAGRGGLGGRGDGAEHWNGTSTWRTSACSVTWWHGEHDANVPHRRCPTLARAEWATWTCASGRTPATSSPSIGTTRSSKSSSLADDIVLRSLRIENLVLIREAELSFGAGPERRHGRDRGRQDDLRAGDRSAARRARRRVGRRHRRDRRRTSRPSSTCPTASSTRRTRGARRAATRGRGRARASRAASSATGARARTPGVGRSRARTSPPPPSG